jgi:hypothetical protein
VKTHRDATFAGDADNCKSSIPEFPAPPAPGDHEHAPDPPAESQDGVDLTLIQYTLSLTPLQRLELLQDWVDGLTELRRGRVGKPKPSPAA